jgi:transcriptional regulator with XRE-family HTH domain
MGIGRIKRVRELRQFTQRYMAMRLGIEQCTYSRIEAGTIRPDPERLQRIAEVLEVSVEDLSGTDPLMFVVDKGLSQLQPTGHAGMVSEAFMKQVTDRLSHVIEEQQQLLRAEQQARASMLQWMKECLGRSMEQEADRHVVAP